MKKLLLLILSLAITVSLSAQIEVVSTGKVGIGTASPIAKLDVNGSINFGSADGSAVAVGTNTTFTPAGGNPTAYYGMTFGGYVTNSLSLSGYNGLAVYTGAGAERMRIDQYGNVGIGVSNPQVALHVKSTPTGATALRLTDNVRGTLNVDFPAASQVRFGVEAAEDLLFAGGGTTLFTIKNVNGGGNVGIGTASPSYKLQVVGSVRATSFISDTYTYADFVFRPDYSLPALSEVEAHIKERGHLPGIPSEAEARKDGIDLAAMQVKLLQKVEELTLHAIAQEKRTQAQEKEIAALREELTALKNR